VALIDNRRDALAAWMMMKRGCRALFLVQDEEAMKILERWDPEPRRVTGTPGKLAYVNKAQGVVVGWSLDDIARAQELNVDVPIYHPLIGMDDAEVERRLRDISS